MRLKQFSVKGFKSIENLMFENLGDFNIIVGENNTGKSNILDAIHVLISNITPLNVFESKNYPDELWPDAQREANIEWMAVFEFPIGDLLSRLDGNASKALQNIGYESDIPHDASAFVLIDRVLGKDSKKWQTRSILLNDLKYSSSDGWASRASHAGEIASKIDTAVMNMIRSCLKRVDVVRGSVARGHDESRTGYSGTRSTLVPRETLDSIVKMFTDWNDSSQKRIELINRLFGVLTTGCQVNARGNTIVIKDGTSETPVHTVGGGIQEMLHLAYDLSVECNILLLEEPEAHLHPRLTQILFRELKLMSVERQIFVSTHSTAFMDQANLSDIWLVTKGTDGTKCDQLQKGEDLQRIADELGLLPSQVCMSNSLLFVEGPADRIIVSKWCEVLGMPLGKPLVHLEEMDGKDKGKRKADTWRRITRALPGLGLGLLFDADLSDRELEDISRAIGPQNKVWRLDEGTIEDYYPLDLLKSVIISGIEMSEKQMKSIQNLQAGQVAKQIDSVLGKGESWKVTTARSTADACTSKTDVPPQMIGILTDIIKYLEEKSEA